MDCEKFESVMLDELYGELDELTSAAAKRHVAGCARCSTRMGALRATRRLAAVRLLEPAGDLEDRVLAAAERAHAGAPPRPRLSRLLSLAGSWAMRPQTAMAAVFLVMIGTSVLFLHVRTARYASSADVRVTERGTPAPAIMATPPPPRAELEWQPSVREEKLANVSSPKTAAGPAATPPPAGLAFASPPTRPSMDRRAAREEDLSPGAPFDDAMRSYRAGRFDEAARGFDTLAAGDPNAALWAARSVRDGQGCAAALSRFDATARQARQAPAGWDALLEGALCYRQVGDFATARARLAALLGVDSHKDRARAELARIDELEQAQSTGYAPPVSKAALRARSAGVALPSVAPPAGAAGAPAAAPRPAAEPADSSP